ncbi:MAG TPA: metallophosphoesterase [Kofleriaceae bacterium]|nr:metallophosphoesterase [Kofleriaceae bacterium]
MKLLALSDLHVGFEANRRALDSLADHRDDWLVLAGDLGETREHVETVLRATVDRFARVLWVPGNHELWTLPTEGPAAPRGVARYEALVALCRAHGVLTPEDPYPVWPGDGPPCVIAPLFLLYDYSFRPDSVPFERALDWAAESGVACADEAVLHPDPYPTREAWCAARCDATEARLAAVDPALCTVLVNHFPLRYDLSHLPAIPRFTLWCGTRRTEDWHKRFRAVAVVSGHLHIPSTRHRDGVRFEEVSVGYPRQWESERGLESKLREILPGPPRV